MEPIVFWTAVYFAAGALVGQLHLLRCPSCTARFHGWADHAKYILASALVAVPMTLVGFMQYWFAPCEDQ